MLNTESIIEISPGESCLLLQVNFSDGNFGSIFRINLMLKFTVLLIYFNLCVCNETGPYHSTVQLVLVIACKNKLNIKFRNIISTFIFTNSVVCLWVWHGWLVLTPHYLISHEFQHWAWVLVSVSRFQNACLNLFFLLD